MNSKEEVLEILDTLLKPAPKSVDFTHAKASKSFDEASANIVRQSHAKEAVKKAPVHEFMNLGGHKMVFAANAVCLHGQHFALFCIGHVEENMLQTSSDFAVDGAYRLYGSEDEVKAWCSLPRKGFVELLERYSLGFLIDGERLLWIPMMIMSLDEQARKDTEVVAQKVFEGLGVAEYRQMPDRAFLARIGESEEDKIIVAGPTLLNLALYKSDVASKSPRRR